LAEKQWGNKSLGSVAHGWENSMKMDFKQICFEDELDWVGLGQDPVACFCDISDEPLDSKQEGIFWRAE